jgi:hypothetical protein
LRQLIDAGLPQTIAGAGGQIWGAVKGRGTVSHEKMGLWIGSRKSVRGWTLSKIYPQNRKTFNCWPQVKAMLQKKYGWRLDLSLKICDNRRFP